MNTCLVIIPTYNEKENIKDIINAVLVQGAEFNVLVVDDNSPDHTSEIVKSHQQFEKRVFILERPGKLGLGSAYIAGFRFGIENRYDFIFEMDADFSHDPNTLPKLKAKALDSNADIVVGSRYTRGGGIKDWSLDRHILSYGASLYVRMITFMMVKDPTAGFICYKASLLQKLNLDKISLKGYGFQIEMKFAAHSNGFKIVEFPIVFKDRELGESKMNGTIIFEAMLGVIKIKLKSLSGFYNVD